VIYSRNFHNSILQKQSTAAIAHKTYHLCAFNLRYTSDGIGLEVN